MKSPQFLYRVRNSNGGIIGYEYFDPKMGWVHMHSLKDDAAIHRGTIRDTIDVFERKLFTGINDSMRMPIFDGDKLVDKNGKEYTVEWNQQQSGWWVSHEIMEIADYNPHVLSQGVIFDKAYGYRNGGGGEGVFMFEISGRLGNGYYHRDDLTLVA